MAGHKLSVAAANSPRAQSEHQVWAKRGSAAERSDKGRNKGAWENEG